MEGHKIGSLPLIQTFQLLVQGIYFFKVGFQQVQASADFVGLVVKKCRRIQVQVEQPVLEDDSVGTPWCSRSCLCNSLRKPQQ